MGHGCRRADQRVEGAVQAAPPVGTPHAVHGQDAGAVVDRLGQRDVAEEQQQQVEHRGQEEDVLRVPVRAPPPPPGERQYNNHADASTRFLTDVTPQNLGIAVVGGLTLSTALTLATEGAAFTECFVTSPVCVGARASLFTGKYPHGCQVFSNFQPWQPTWVSLLADRGYLEAWVATLRARHEQGRKEYGDTSMHKPRAELLGVRSVTISTVETALFVLLGLSAATLTSHVIYGLRGYKTHAKICLVVRRTRQGIRRYVHLGTGNYNDRTARAYTDFGLMTADADVGQDASAFFNAA